MFCPTAPIESAWVLGRTSKIKHLWLQIWSWSLQLYRITELQNFYVGRDQLTSGMAISISFLCLTLFSTWGPLHQAWSTLLPCCLAGQSLWGEGPRRSVSGTASTSDSHPWFHLSCVMVASQPCPCCGLSLSWSSPRESRSFWPRLWPIPTGLPAHLKPCLTSIPLTRSNPDSHPWAQVPAAAWGCPGSSTAQLLAAVVAQDGLPGPVLIPGGTPLFPALREPHPLGTFFFIYGRKSVLLFSSPFWFSRDPTGKKKIN